MLIHLLLFDSKHTANRV